MKEYILILVLTVLAGSVIITLSPEGGAGGGVRLLCSLCTVACIAVPLISLVSKGLDPNALGDLPLPPDIEAGYYDEIYNTSLVDSEVKNAEISLKNAVKKEFNVSDDAFDIRISAKKIIDENYSISVELIIYRYGIGIDPHSVEKYVKNMLECSFTTVYAIK